jgi:methionyl-tRNA synthetase
MIPIDDFFKVDIRVGMIVEVEDADTKKPMYKIKVDFGPDIGVRQAVAGIKPYYAKEELLNKKFVFVVNIEPKKIGSVLSECMILAASQNDKVVILQPERDIDVGAKIS